MGRRFLRRFHKLGMTCWVGLLRKNVEDIKSLCRGCIIAKDFCSRLGWGMEAEAEAASMIITLNFIFPLGGEP